MPGAVHDLFGGVTEDLGHLLRTTLDEHCLARRTTDPPFETHGFETVVVANRTSDASVSVSLADFGENAPILPAHAKRPNHHPPTESLYRGSHPARLVLGYVRRYAWTCVGIFDRSWKVRRTAKCARAKPVGQGQTMGRGRTP